MIGLARTVCRLGNSKHCSQDSLAEGGLGIISLKVSNKDIREFQIMVAFRLLCIFPATDLA